jgi:hypothetical protein
MGSGACVVINETLIMKYVRRIFSRENLYALLLCLLLIALIVLTTSQAPQWIYQGF